MEAYAPTAVTHEGTAYTFDDLARLDPAIKALELLARRAAPADGDPSYLVFYHEVKPLVCALAGWLRRSRRSDGLEVLSTAGAYDVVYHHLAAVIGGER